MTLAPFAALAALGLAATGPAAVPFASAAEVKARVAALDASMKPGQGFAWQPLVGDGEYVAALEIWKAPGRPAIHPAEAEYVMVVDGAGTLLSGGTLRDATVVRPGLTEGSRIEGGIARPLRPGDVVLIAAGTPHWFGITGKRLVLLGTKMPVHAD